MALNRSIAGHRATIEAVKQHQEQQLAAAERAEALLRKPNVWVRQNREAQQALALLIRLAGGHAPLLEQVEAGEVVLEGVLAKIAAWRCDPVAFVRECLNVVPDAWQVRVLTAAATRQRLAMCCGKGPGKTATDVWIIAWYLATRPHPRALVASGSEDQLRDTVIPELSKWFNRSFLLTEWFEVQKQRIVHRAAPETWWLSARSWSRSADPQTAGESLAGVHEKYALVCLDESAQMPESLLAIAEAALSTGSETRLVLSGNPTSKDGALFRAAVKDAQHWHVTHVSGDPDDPERSPRISADWAKSMIDRYGRDSPFVQVSVLGQFPDGSLNTLLAREEVLLAMQRPMLESIYRHSALVLGVDVARYGLDATVFCLRQGLRVLEFQIFRNLSNMDVAARVCSLIDKHKVDATFIDAGAGSGVIDRCRQLGYTVTEVPFAGSPRLPRYANKRAEMYWDMSEWVRDSGSMPYSTELLDELVAFSYAIKRDRIQCIDKEELRAVLGRSPDQADALALTFAAPVAPRMTDWKMMLGRGHLHAYDPWERNAEREREEDGRARRH